MVRSILLMVMAAIGFVCRETANAYVTVFLFTGEQITGIVQLSEPVDNLEPAPLAA